MVARGRRVRRGVPRTARQPAPGRQGRPAPLRGVRGRRGPATGRARTPTSRLAGPGRFGPGRALHRRGGLQPVAARAAVPGGDAVRPGRSADRPRRLVLHLHAAVPGIRSPRDFRGRRAGTGRLGGRLRGLRRDYSPGGRHSGTRAGPQASAAARRGRLPAVRLGRVSGNAATADDAGRHRARGVVRRRGSASAGAADPDGGVGVRRGRLRLRGVREQHVAGGGRDRHVPARVDRRRRDRDGPAAPGGHAGRAAEGGAVHRPQHRRDARRVRPRRG